MDLTMLSEKVLERSMLCYITTLVKPALQHLPESAVNFMIT